MTEESTSTAAMASAAWLADASNAVAELRNISDLAESAVVLPSPTLELPASTTRHLPSVAVLRLRTGQLRLLTILGHRFTSDSLAKVAETLEAQGEVTSNARLVNLEHLGLPNVQIELPSQAHLQGSGWGNVRPCAVAIALASAFAGGKFVAGGITSADARALEMAIRGLLAEAMARFRAGLDEEALALCEPFQDFAPQVYEYLVAEPYRRNRKEFGNVLPLFLQAVAMGHDEAPYREIRQAIDACEPLSELVCNAVGVGPSVFRGLVNVPIEVCGRRWADTPAELLKLLNLIRPERRPRLDPTSWATLNRLVKHAEDHLGRNIHRSLVAQAFVRDSMNAQGAVRDVRPGSQLDPRTQSIIEEFREHLYGTFGARNPAHANAVRSTVHDELCEVIDQWLLKRTRKQMEALASRWQETYALEKADNASLVACAHGDYWPLIPGSLMSKDGRRRIVPLVSRRQLVDHGAAMLNCLQSSHLRAYHTACRLNDAFVVALVDAENGNARSTAELKLKTSGNGKRIDVELVQHTARRNAAPSSACVAAISELLLHVAGDAVQRHLQLGIVAVRSIRKRGLSAISAAQRETRLRSLRQVLGDRSFEELQTNCDQVRRQSSSGNNNFVGTSS